MAEFTETFNVGSPADRYKSFIARLRSLARDPNTLSHQLPVLLPQQNPPTRFFDVVLRTERRSVRLRIRRDNLYLDGYRDEDGDQWYEFNNGGNEHLIAGSIFLGFTGSYVAMQNNAGRRREDISLGQLQLNTAVNDLVGSTVGGDRARALIVIIQMICESMRFVFITNAIADNYTGSGLLPTPRILALENGWGPVSGAGVPIHEIEVDDEIPGGRYSPRWASERGMLARANRFVVSPVTVIDVIALQAVDCCDGAVELTWILTVNVRDAHVEDFDQRSAVGDQGLVCGGLHINVSPRPGTSNSVLTQQDTDRGQIAWNVYDHTNVYDKLRVDTISGKYGSAALNYVVMSNAAEALVEVILINGDGEDPADVYGRIYSQNSSFDGEIKLFRRSAKDCVDVRPNNPIPLLRSALAVPMDASLKISAHLWDHDPISSDDEIAKGTAEFKPEILKSASKFIEGQYGKVEVRVSWM
ncbi:MAG: hypothetical protein M1813_004348 [Trichoglossum hirsutum]|nr:MAG: hypothetical protein M1813_004348 [Trichoglossum hirsutum]